MQAKSVLSTPCTLFLSVLLSAPLHADSPQEGFALADLPYPLQGATATLASGNIVAFDGQEIELYDALGNLLLHLASLSSRVFPSFILIDAAENRVIFGESSVGQIYELALSPGAPNPVALLPLNYDAVFEDDDHVIVSAATSGFGNGNKIYRVELSTGATTLLADVAGASGPVALDRVGNLLYGTASSIFPAPPASSQVIRWDAALLTGAVVLSEDDAVVIEAGFDGAADLVVDPVDGGIYLAENNFGNGVNRIRLVAGNPFVQPFLVEGTGFRTISNLEFLPGDGSAIFAGFQPPRGGTLLYNTTDFVSVFERKSLSALRPTGYVSGPGTSGPGPFDVGVVDGPSDGFGFIFYGPLAQYNPNETVFQLKRPVFVGLNLSTLGRAPGTIRLGGSGEGHLTFTNPGGLQGQWAMQVLLFDADGDLVGSSTAAFL